MKKALGILSVTALLFLIACNGPDTTASEDSEPKASTPVISYSVVSVLPHDTSYFTEGLEFYNNYLLESTGNYDGRSKLVKLDLAGNKILNSVTLDPKQFGEGITVFRDTIYQLTYKERIINVYSAKDLKKIKELPYNLEGWGLTNDGKSLIASDGSSNLYFFEPGTFRQLRVQAVTENGTPAVNINELEYIKGYIYANQWQYNYILKIDPSNGAVVAKMDYTELVNKVKAKDPHADVLNGIAYNPTTDKIYITGKYFPELYEVQFSH